MELTPHPRGTTADGKRLLLLAPASGQGGRAVFIERAVVFVQAEGAGIEAGTDFDPMSVEEAIGALQQP